MKTNVDETMLTANVPDNQVKQYSAKQYSEEQYSAKQYAKDIATEKIRERKNPIESLSKQTLENTLSMATRTQYIKVLKPGAVVDENDPMADKEKLMIDIPQYPEMSEAVNYVGDAIAKSNYMIAQSILVASNAVASAIEQYADVVENKNKLDEYYMLLNDIEKYEDTLLELNCFEDAYKKLNLSLRQTISIEEWEICMMCKIVQKKDIISKIFSHVQDVSMSPLETLYSFIKDENVWNLHTSPWIKDYTPLSITNDTFTVQVEGITEPCLRFNGVEREHLQITKYTSYKEKRSEYSYRYHEIYEIVTTGEDFAKAAMMCVYNSITKKDIEEMFKNNMYLEIVNRVASINQSIQLSNLRNLHAALRSQLRRCKIEKRLSGE